MIRIAATLALLATALPLCGCYVGPGYGGGRGGNWCYWHPARCR